MRNDYWCGYCDGYGYTYYYNEQTPCKHCSGLGYASTNHYGSDDPEEQERKRKEDPYAEEW